MHILEQGEDLYEILINIDIIVFVEVNRYNKNEVLITKSVDIFNYEKGLSKLNRIKLAVAVDLAKKDIRNISNN